MTSNERGMWAALAFAALVGTASASCSSEAPAERFPEDDDWVSSGTVCLGNGTVHDPNPAGCSQGHDCRRSPASQSGDWQNGYVKNECANTDWLTGISTNGSAVDHYFNCAASPYTSLSGGSIAADSCTVVRPAAGWTSRSSSSNASSDWDPNYGKLECAKNAHVSGYSRNSDGDIISILCCTFPNEATNANCSAETYADSVTDHRESTNTGDWDTGYVKLECGTGRVIAGVSEAVNGGSTGNATYNSQKVGRLHGILCCDATPSFTAQSTYNPNPSACSQSKDCRFSPNSKSGDWAHGWTKYECANTDVLSGLSFDGNAVSHDMFCSLSNYTNASGGNAAVTSDQCTVIWTWSKSYPLTNGSGTTDWDSGYAKAECPSNMHIAGIGKNGSNGAIASILCCPFPGESNNTNCSGQTFNGGVTDHRENTTTGDWDSGYAKLECGAGRVMAGISESSNTSTSNQSQKLGTVHGILCCDSVPSSAYSSCCNDASFNAAVAKCTSDASSNMTYCNLVDYCCQTGVSSYAGSEACAEVAYAEDPSTEGGTGLTTAPTSSNPANSPTCAAGGTTRSWSYSYTLSKIRGNNGFGAAYEGSVALAADSLPTASAEAKLTASATLFGATISLVSFDALAQYSTTASSASLDVKALGSDISGYPKEMSSGVTYGNTWEQNLFEQEKLYVIGGVPVTIAGSLDAQYGISDSVSLTTQAIGVTAVPFFDLSATASAALGGSLGGFITLEGGVEGELTLLDMSLNNTATVTPTRTGVNYSVNGSLTSTEISGTISAFVKGKFLFFSKTWSHTMAKFTAGQQSTPYLAYSGCMTY